VGIRKNMKSWETATEVAVAKTLDDEESRNLYTSCKCVRPTVQGVTKVPYRILCTTYIPTEQMPWLLFRRQTIPIEPPGLFCEVSVNICG
jgi:hypothetical protein